jgi:hypothetical protein
VRGTVATFVFLLSTLSPTSVGAMSVGSDPISRCQVVGGDKLLASSGGSATVCAEIERAIAASAPNAQYSIEVKVLSTSRLAASVMVDGHALPEQNFAIMDSDLNAGAIQRFAASLAKVVAHAARAPK